MAPLTKRAVQTEASLVGKPWNNETLQEVYPLLLRDLPLDPNAPGGMVDYRRSLALSFFFKFFNYVCSQIESLAASLTNEVLITPLGVS